jgi:hypothetical protein
MQGISEDGEQGLPEDPQSSDSARLADHPGQGRRAFLSPDRVNAATWHRTPSAGDAMKRFVAELRKGGFEWPPPR